MLATEAITATSAVCICIDGSLGLTCFRGLITLIALITHFFLGSAPALHNPAGLAPVLSPLSSLSSHIFCTSPEGRQKMTDRK
jgi:hypothetical protein